MKTPFSVSVSLFMLACAVRASDPIASFAQELATNRADEAWFVPSDNTATHPKGGYLYRFETDLNGDGQKEVFVATSLDVERRGELWSVFKKDTTGEYQNIEDALFLGSELRMKIENGVHKYSFYVLQKEEDGGNYYGYFWLDAAGNWHSETHALTDAEQKTKDGEDPEVLGEDGKPDEQKIAQKLNLGNVVTITVEKVLLAKYLQNAAAPWREANSRFSLAQQYKDPADAADIASVANWQPPPNPLEMNQ